MAHTAVEIARKGKGAVEKRNAVLEELKVEYVRVDDLKPNPYNPNRQTEHDFDLLIRSMTEDGFTQPIVAQRDTMQIVDGEHRWRAAARIGLQEIPVVFVNMTPEQMRISTLRHNRARGSEDIELSAQVLRDLRELGALDWVKDSLMIDDASLSRLLEDESAPDALAHEEFSKAWVPNKSRDYQEQPDEIAEDGTRREVISITPAAKAVRAEIETKMANAKTTEEFKELNRIANSGVFVLNLTFSGEDAVLAKSVLLPSPAAAVLRLCTAKLAAEGRLDENGKVK